MDYKSSLNPLLLKKYKNFFLEEFFNSENKSEEIKTFEVNQKSENKEENLKNIFKDVKFSF